MDKKKTKSVAIFGAGIAGLSAAHEFVKLGYKVSIYEANSDAGGFFRSARMKADKNMPSEYSWHGFGPWYLNVFDIMKQIPFDSAGNVYDKSLSRPVDFGVVPDTIDKSINYKDIFKKPRSFRMTIRDKAHLGYDFLKTWTSDERSEEVYSRINAAVYWRPKLSAKGWQTWISIFGPWIGSDHSNASLHHVGLFFRKNIMPGATHKHKADSEGPAWDQGAASLWLLLRGPSSEWWFDKWVKHLQDSGVKFHWEKSLEKLNKVDSSIDSAILAGGQKVRADKYVLAISPFATVDVLAKSPELAGEEQLSKFLPLTQDGPHTQVSFRIAFSERINFKKDRTAVILADSEYNITLFAQEQVWPSSVSLGEGVMSLWTGTACVSNIPGRIYKKPLANCTKEEFIDEIRAQIFDCKGLNFMVNDANSGRDLSDFDIVRVEVWHEWLFSVDGIKANQPKWVTTMNTQPHLPNQKTTIPNLVLAGAHTRTKADVWSIEGAAESGRRAAKIIEPDVAVLEQYKSPILKVLSSVDNLLYRRRLPQLLDVTSILIVLLLTTITVGYIL